MRRSVNARQAPGRGLWRQLCLALTCLGLVSTGASACGGRVGQRAERYDREQLAARLESPESVQLEIGVFPLTKGAIVDGDTIKVGGLDESLRLLALDTEETFKSESARRAYEQGWEVYLAAEKAKTTRPIKVPTPLGEDAKHFAEDFFDGVRRVRLERDHPKEIRGRFNRFLAYVFVEKDGEWVNYNLEAVRAGMSPYFTKYAYSRRFHDEFVEAQAQAQAAQLGIWSPEGEHYDDYGLRLQWWNARADFIAEFEAEAADKQDMIVLTHWDATRRLAGLVDREVEVLATVGEVRPRVGKAPARVMLSRRMFGDLPLIFWDEAVLEASGIEAFKGEFVRVKGLVTEYRPRDSDRRILQIEVRLPAQVRLPPYTPPGREGVVAPAVDPHAGGPTSGPEVVDSPSPSKPEPETSSDASVDDAPGADAPPTSEPAPSAPPADPPAPSPADPPPTFF